MCFFHKRLSSPQGWELPEGKSLICFAYHWIPGKWHSAWHVLGTFLTIQSKTSISLPFISLRCSFRHIIKQQGLYLAYFILDQFFHKFRLDSSSIILNGIHLGPDRDKFIKPRNFQSVQNQRVWRSDKSDLNFSFHIY